MFRGRLPGAGTVPFLRWQAGELVEPAIEHTAIIDFRPLGNFGRLWSVPLELAEWNAAIHSRLFLREPAFGDMYGERHLRAL